ncbi:hypothetical protein GJAV_G00188650 [Gymnothorax javanicus]|nr:hypothetical protein GJAV_G00188650 [Gymnothorax javanicus]
MPHQTQSPVHATLPAAPEPCAGAASAEHRIHHWHPPAEMALRPGETERAAIWGGDLGRARTSSITPVEILHLTEPAAPKGLLHLERLGSQPAISQGGPCDKRRLIRCGQPCDAGTGYSGCPGAQLLCPTGTVGLQPLSGV